MDQQIATHDSPVNAIKPHVVVQLGPNNMVTVDINGVTVNGLVDSGAEKSIINGETLRGIQANNI